MKVKHLILLLVAAVFTLSACNKQPVQDPDDQKGTEVPEPGPNEEDPNENQQPVTDPHEGWEKIKEIFYISPLEVIPQPKVWEGSWPDARFITIKRGDKWQLYWPQCVTFLTEADTPWVEDHLDKMRDDGNVFGKGLSSVFELNENGSWFNGIFPRGKAGHYVGFFHGESHWPGAGWTAYKGLGVAYSDDYGYTWHDAAPIIVSPYRKSETPEWSGLGDACVIWDSANERYICYYQTSIDGKTRLCMAASSDPEGASGTWKKWDGEDFTVEAYNAETKIGGPDTMIDEFKYIAGANPHVIWNTYLGKWTMFFHNWSTKFYYTTSDDLIHWDSPTIFYNTKGPTISYPSIICEDGEKTCGQSVRLYFAIDLDDIDGIRSIGLRYIDFI